MKKIISLFLAILLIVTLTGCGNNTARGAVENYLKKYNNLSSEVLVDIENVITKDSLNDDAKDKYRDVLKKQYKDLEYKIVEEEYDADVSYVTVNISVYDLYKAGNDSSIYLENHRDEFLNDLGEYDVNKYNLYRLERMKNTTDKVDYTIIFTVTKEKDKYVVEQPTENDLMKLHGVYNYDLD